MTSPHHVTNAVVAGIADEIAERMGKRGSSIYAMGEYPEKDRYTKFIQLWSNTADVDFNRADIFFRDFESRRNARCPARQIYRTTERKALASVSDTINEVMKGQLQDKADHEKLRLIAEAEEALRVLSSAILCASVSRSGTEKELRENAGR